jgi:ribose transport system substrate-binding protein
MLLAPALSLASLAACSGGDVVRVAFVTNNASDFWTIVRRGCEKADAELAGVEVDFRIPHDGTAAQQKQIVDDLLSRGCRGIAISPVDPANQTQMLDAAAERAAIVCSDSDAPKSRRLCYVGTDNVAAGRQAGELVRKLLPNGGEIVAFVGTLDAQNAVERLRGLQEVIDGSGVYLRKVLTDETDRVRSKSNVLDALTTYPEAGCLVGIWSYNGPAILNAVQEHGRLGKIGIVCFDEEEETLAGVERGHIAATVVQQPYEFGYQSIRLLAEIAGGDRSRVPKDGLLHVPTRVIGPGQVAGFRAELNRIRGR